MSGDAAEVYERCYERGHATHLSFADGSYDVVMSQFALMYFPDRAAAVEEMWRVQGRAAGSSSRCGVVRASDRLRDPDGGRAAAMVEQRRMSSRPHSPFR